jgi:hypothetical protein
MPNSKLKSKGSLKGVTGGNGNMIPRQYAGPQKPGTTATDASGSGGKWAAGGKGRMTGKPGGPAKPA